MLQDSARVGPVWSAWILVSLLILVPEATAGTGAEPDDFGPLELYFISTDFGPQAIATCSTQACYDEPFTEIADISRVYCDTTPGAISGAVGYAPEGCVRWWEDQGDHDCGLCGTGEQSDEWIRGHKHGQDDLQKPAYVSSCLHGEPCARIPTVADLGPNATQIACLELETNDTVRVDGDFSLFFLAAPRDQPADWWYFGTSNNGLLHSVADDSLYFRADATQLFQLSTPGAMPPIGWHLIEVHRDTAGRFEVRIDGRDRTLPDLPANSASYFHRYLGAQNCNGTSEGMVGDIATFLLYSRRLGSDESRQVREYLDDLFQFTRFFSDGFESGDLAGWSSHSTP